jgi:8-oxo-dGTP pyrophosphatase MutT (NUDIX family)
MSSRPQPGGAAEPRTRAATSSGGVVFRRVPSGVEIVLVARPSEGLWALPKGTPERGETREQTALREVEEETGLAARLLDELGEVRYQFTDRDGMTVDKTVYYFLMTPTGGHVNGHDHEHELVGWFDIHEAQRLLTHRNQIHILDRAAECIERRAAGDHA